EVKVVDLTFSRNLSAFEEAIRSFRPGLVGVHTKTLTAARSIEIAQRTRAAGIYLLAGGPDAASRPDHYLRGGFDAVVQGEGEEVLVDVARRVADGTDPAGLPGLSVLRGDRIVRGPPRPFLRDLDALPFPAWDLVDMEGYLSDWERRTGERRTAVLTSRGC
ncbi:radical SAM domain protein, partial [mine drainage metagenome]